MSTELKYFGVLGMKWGKHKAKPIKSSNPVEITLSTDGRFYLHDTPGVVLQANRPFGRRDKKIIDDAERRYKRGEIDDIE